MIKVLSLVFIRIFWVMELERVDHIVSIKALSSLKYAKTIPPEIMNERRLQISCY